MIRKINFFLLIFTLISLSVRAQDDTSDDDNGPAPDSKGFHVGLIVGAYFANNYTASVYDGYGYDFDGNKNSFATSYMYNKIVLQYGGYYSGLPDLIAQALNVNHGDWFFQESDMPINMRYAPAFNVGLQCRYSVDKNNAVLFNVNGSQLNITGNFTITTNPPANANQYYKSIQTFAIKGVEQRLIFQLGYQRVFGEADKFNFFMEGGMNITMTKFDKNQILINGLLIDLTTPFNQAGYDPFNVKKPHGTGFGVFGGLGLNLNPNGRYRVQLVYNPSYENIKIGSDPKLKFQHGIGLRAYYSF